MSRDYRKPTTAHTPKAVELPTSSTAAAATKPSCENCHYWQAIGATLGRCRKSPPMYVREAGPDGPIVTHGLTRAENWCGSYQPK